MPASRKHLDSSARPSNAGDRYHFVYVARRLLDLLHPYTGLVRLVIENVSPADQATPGDLAAFLGVDVSEYYDGTDVATAQTVDLVQVKYSPLRPAEPWTRSRLTAKKKGGESVFYKLAAMFHRLAPTPDLPSSRAEVRIRLLTNQPLDSGLRELLKTLRATVTGKHCNAAGRALAAVPGEPGQTALALRRASGLTWTRFAELLVAWDLAGFGSPSLGRSEAELFEALSGFSPDGSERLESLLGHIQLRATPGQRETFERRDVLAFLRLTGEQLEPAPTAFPDDPLLFETQDVERVQRVVREGAGRVVVHGRSGCGKTSSLRLALRHHSGGKAVIYDCYADGQGILPGAERFPSRKCFTQVVNDLEARYRTGILATVGLDYQSLMRQLDRALKAAAAVAAREGHELILAFDAIDNAYEQERRAPEAGDSFLPILWRLRPPSNCILIVSLRTENLADVVGDKLPDARTAELRGFDVGETRYYAAQLAPALSLAEADFLHARTAGNPRVQNKVLAEIASSPPENSHRLIEETARRTAFAYYDQEVESGRRLAKLEVRRVLAVLYEMRQAPGLADVAAITRLSEAEVREVIDRLSFGLRLEREDRVAWQDQDFLDWTGKRLGPECQVARETLADHCRSRFDQDEYARWNLSYHLLLAERFDELVGWWRQPGRLDGQILAAHPHEERVLDDLRAAMLAALRIGQRREAFDLLLRAADLAEGRDAFAEALAGYPGVAVAADLAHLIPGGPSGQDRPPRTQTWRNEAEQSLAIAAEFARRPECRETAQEVYAKFKAAKDTERVRDPQEGGGLNVDEWEVYARYQTRMRGFAGALKLLSELDPGPWSRLFALAAGADWSISGASDPLGLLTEADLGPAECGATALGILAGIDPDHRRGVPLKSLGAASVEKAVLVVMRALTREAAAPPPLLQGTPKDGLYGRPERIVVTLGSAVENLTAAGFLEAGRRLLSIWFARRPQFSRREQWEPYLQWAALQEALTGTAFAPAMFELIPFATHSGSGKSSGRATEESEREAGIRREMQHAYPLLRVRALAWVGAEPEAVAAELRRLVADWQKEWIHPREGFELSYQEGCAILLEAIVALPGSHVALVREVVDAGEHALDRAGSLARIAGADVLSREERYLAEADRLIRKELEHCRPPAVPAREAMDRLFQLYHPAARISSSLARQVIVAARDVASEIDSRIYARAEALTGIAEAARADLDPELLDEVCALTRYWWSVDRQSARNAGERALVLLAQVGPGAAITRAFELDLLGLLNFEDGLWHAAVSALEERSLAPEDAWPILPLLVHPDAVARDAIEQLHQRGLSVAAPLSAYCRQARLDGAPISRPAERAQEIVSWAHRVGLDAEPAIRQMRSYSEALELALTEARRGQRPPKDEESERLSGSLAALSKLFEAVVQAIPQLPRAALARLEDATNGELAELTEHELRELLPRLMEVLPLSDRSKLASVIERWGAGDKGALALPLLDSLLGDGGKEEPDIASAVAGSVGRLLTADTLASLAYPHARERWSILLHGRWAPPGTRLDAALRAVAEGLRDLGSDSVFFLARNAASLLDPEDLAGVARDFIARTVADAPNLGDPAFPGPDAQRTIPYAMVLALGHPRQALRWRGVYAVVHALADSGHPETFLGPLLDTMERTDLPRWLSVREWLAFALEHVALREPGLLQGAVPRLIPHALSRELPHAKIRHHLKQVLLAIEASSPGALGKDLAAIESLNMPVAIVRSRTDSAGPMGREAEQGPSAKGEDRLMPDPMDTVRYWYEPLARCFAGESQRVQRAVVQKAVDWMARLGITRSAVDAEHAQLGDRYNWAASNNDHGNQPRVELLRLYGERHGLYLAAGELIDTTPVVETTWSDGPGTEWDEWARYDLRGGDPALPARLLEAPTPLADSYGVFASPADRWAKETECDAFPDELRVPGEPGWIVVLADREGLAYDRSFEADVRSALVSPRTASAMARLLESGSRDAFLPFRELPYDCILPDIERDLERFGRGSEPLRGEHTAAGVLFTLKAWVVRFYQEGSLHALDPVWPIHGRHYGLPGLDVVRRLGWTRHPADLVWRDAAGQAVARCDLFRRSDGRDTHSSGGFRLVMRRDGVAAYAQATGLEVIFAVRLRRQVRSNDRASGKQEFDPGRTHCFLWSDLGKLGAGTRS